MDRIRSYVLVRAETISTIPTIGEKTANHLTTTPIPTTRGISRSLTQKVLALEGLLGRARVARTVALTSRGFALSASKTDGTIRILRSLIIALAPIALILARHKFTAPVALILTLHEFLDRVDQ